VSELAQMVAPGIAPDGTDSNPLPDLVSLLVASGDLFYEWDLESAEVFNHEYWIRDDAGQFVWIQERAVATHGHTGKPMRLTGVVRNIDARKKTEEEVSFLSNHDALTGQHNRLRLRESLEHVIAQSLITGAQGGLLLVGIDKLNEVSDVYGEDTADAIVLAAARRIEDGMRTGDVVGRVGFDRFAVVVGNCNRDELANVAHRFLSAIRETPISTPSGAMTITASIGISVFPSDASSARTVVSHADNALRAARRLGCDCYLDYAEVPEHTRTERPELVIVEKVKQALKDDRFKLAFQPVVSAETGAVEFCEGLARMIDPEGNVIAAGGFVPVIEQMRLIDRRVLELGLDALEHNPDMHLAINLSGMTAVDPVWLRMLEERLQGRRDLACRLILEITETVALDDVDESSRFVSTLTQFSCRVALDDFGAGFTSFRHLRTLNVAIVKIDGSFVRDIVSNPENLLFVRTLVNLAKGIGLKCVGEWVETAEEAALLKQEGVDFLQGWHCGKPEVDPDWLRTAD